MFHALPRVKKLGALAFMPALYLAFGFAVRQNSGSALIARDAGYYYLISAYEVALGQWPHLFAHPGATLHVWGGLVVWLKKTFFPESSLGGTSELLSYHARYIRVLGTSLLFPNAFFLGWAGFALRRRGLSLAGVWLVQLLWIATPEALAFTGLYQPESINIGIAAALTVALLSGSTWRWIAVSIVAGAATATKLTYAAYLAPLAIERSWKRALGGALAFLAVFLLFCTVFFPSWGHSFGYFGTLAVSSGDYVSGAPGLRPLSLVRERLVTEGVAYTLLFFPLALFLAFAARRRGAAEDRDAFLSALLVFVGTFLIFLRKPSHGYYVLPALGVLPCVLGTYLILTRHDRRRWLGYTALVGIALYDLAVLPAQIQNHFFLLRDGDASVHHLQEIVNRHSDCAILVASPVPLGADALQMGARGTWEVQLSTQFPSVAFVTDDWQIHVPNRLWFETEEGWRARSGRSCAVLVANPFHMDELKKRFKIARDGRVLECSSYACVLELGLDRR